MEILHHSVVLTISSFQNQTPKLLLYHPSINQQRIILCYKFKSTSVLDFSPTFVRKGTLSSFIFLDSSCCTDIVLQQVAEQLQVYKITGQVNFVAVIWNTLDFSNNCSTISPRPGYNSSLMGPRSMFFCWECILAWLLIITSRSSSSKERLKKSVGLFTRCAFADT